ncbi:hypothetical protein M758_10G091700 [Ceratodon purpureus]|nr:hypothetical protein M758_10G091700 [Ceratodon purpureus]
MPRYCPALEYKARCVVSSNHAGGCSAQSELFFRLLLKNTVRWAHSPAYPIFWIAPRGAQPTSKPNQEGSSRSYITLELGLRPEKYQPDRQIVRCRGSASPTRRPSSAPSSALPSGDGFITSNSSDIASTWLRNSSRQSKVQKISTAGRSRKRSRRDLNSRYWIQSPMS